MNAEQLMRAIGSISDRHIEEFAVVKPVAAQKYTWLKIVSMAACICFVVTAGLGLTKILNRHDAEQISNTTPSEKTIWGSPASSDPVEDYWEQTDTGTIVITKSLKTAMERIEDESARFAVFVTETTGKEREYVYNSFISALNVKESYMESGIIFLTMSQIRSLECPPDLALILSLAEVSSSKVKITAEQYEKAERTLTRALSGKRKRLDFPFVKKVNVAVVDEYISIDSSDNVFLIKAVDLTFHGNGEELIYQRELCTQPIEYSQEIS